MHLPCRARTHDAYRATVELYTALLEDREKD